MNRLQTIDADTLQSTAYEPVSFVVDDLLPQGLHLLAGAPKIGKPAGGRAEAVLPAFVWRPAQPAFAAVGADAVA